MTPHSISIVQNLDGYWLEIKADHSPVAHAQVSGMHNGVTLARALSKARAISATLGTPRLPSDATYALSYYADLVLPERLMMSGPKLTLDNIAQKFDSPEDFIAEEQRHLSGEIMLSHNGYVFRWQ